MNNILITGGAGFIGRRLTEKLLSKGHHVRILDNLSPQIHGEVPQGLDWLNQQNIDFHRNSITDAEAVRVSLQGIDTVVHLAAETGTGQSMYEIVRYNDVNVQGTAVLLNILANDPSLNVKRIILASSRSIYGEGAYTCPSCSPQQRVYPNGRNMEQLSAHRWEHSCHYCESTLEPVATCEEDPAKPASIYAATKYAQEDLIRVSCEAMNIDYALLRLQNVYGEGQSLSNPYTGILSIFSTRIRRRQHLPIFEDGLETRDFIHIDDVANAFVAAIENRNLIKQTINVGTGIKTTVSDIAIHLSQAFNCEPNLVTTKEFRLGDIRHNFANIQRLNDVLDYTPKVSLAEGMQRFASWVSQEPLPEDKLDKANAELRTRNLMK